MSAGSNPVSTLPDELKSYIKFEKDDGLAFYRCLTRGYMLATYVKQLKTTGDKLSTADKEIIYTRIARLWYRCGPNKREGSDVLHKDNMFYFDDIMIMECDMIIGMLTRISKWAQFKLAQPVPQMDDIDGVIQEPVTSADYFMHQLESAFGMSAPAKPKIANNVAANIIPISDSDAIVAAAASSASSAAAAAAALMTGISVSGGGGRVERHQQCGGKPGETYKSLFMRPELPPHFKITILENNGKLNASIFDLSGNPAIIKAIDPFKSTFVFTGVNTIEQFMDKYITNRELYKNIGYFYSDNTDDILRMKSDKDCKEQKKYKNLGSVKDVDGKEYYNYPNNTLCDFNATPPVITTMTDVLAKAKSAAEAKSATPADSVPDSIPPAAPDSIPPAAPPADSVPESSVLDSSVPDPFVPAASASVPAASASVPAASASASAASIPVSAFVPDDDANDVSNPYDISAAAAAVAAASAAAGIIAENDYDNENGNGAATDIAATAAATISDEADSADDSNIARFLKCITSIIHYKHKLTAIRAGVKISGPSKSSWSSGSSLSLSHLAFIPALIMPRGGAPKEADDSSIIAAAAAAAAVSGAAGAASFMGANDDADADAQAQAQADADACASIGVGDGLLDALKTYRELVGTSIVSKPDPTMTAAAYFKRLTKFITTRMKRDDGTTFDRVTPSIYGHPLLLYLPFARAFDCILEVRYIHNNTVKMFKFPSDDEIQDRGSEMPVIRIFDSNNYDTLAYPDFLTNVEDYSKNFTLLVDFEADGITDLSLKTVKAAADKSIR